MFVLQCNGGSLAQGRGRGRICLFPSAMGDPWPRAEAEGRGRIKQRRGSHGDVFTQS